MIRKLLLSTVAIAAVTSTAFAADLPSRRAPPVYVPPPIPTFSWTGFYMGGDIGWAFGRDQAFLTGTTAAAVGVAPYAVGTPGGLIGGGHVGYNFSTQSLPVLGPIAGGLSGIPFFGGVGGTGGVVGIEADVTGTDYRGTFGSPGGGAAGAFFNTMRETTGGTVRGRVGIAVDRALFFATGGVAFAQFREQYGLNTGFGSLLLSDQAHTRTGYVVGGGMEYALTTNFSLRAEYRYYNYGHFTDTVLSVPGLLVTSTHSINQQRATVGFSYKFDNPMAPVVARY